MKILLRHYGSLSDDGSRKEVVELASVPALGDEIHWPERILKVLKVMWFPEDKKTNPHGHVACLNVAEVR